MNSHTSSRRPSRLVAFAVTSFATAAMAGATSFQDLGALDPAVEGIDIGQALTQGADGLMYGVTPTGIVDGVYNGGSIFRSEGDGRLTALHTFTGPDGRSPEGPLTLGIDGWLYGTTMGGGAGGLGEIFKISPAGEFVVVHSFAADLDGGLGGPHGQLVSDGQGNFYALGRVGSNDSVFEMAADGRFTVLGVFKGPELGKAPNALTLGPDGVLYGTTFGAPGGAPQSGSVFALRPGGRLRTVHVFAADTDGYQPGSALAFGRDHALYGATTRGGGGSSGGLGTVFRLTTGGDFSVIHAFYDNVGDADPLGWYPTGIASSADGRLYGTTSAGGTFVGGTAFSMSLDGQGIVLHRFQEANGGDGYDPLAVPTWTPDGSLWGTTSVGAAYNDGAVFRIGLGSR